MASRDKNGNVIAKMYKNPKSKTLGEMTTKKPSGSSKGKTTTGPTGRTVTASLGKSTTNKTDRVQMTGTKNIGSKPKPATNMPKPGTGTLGKSKVNSSLTKGVSGKAKATTKPTSGIKLSDSEKKRFATLAGQTASANYQKKVGGLIGPDARANIEVAAEKRTMKTFGKKKAK